MGADAATVAAFVEIVLGVAHHLVAAVLLERLGVHQDGHQGIARTLEAHGHSEAAEALRAIETFRMSHWYGSKKNGEVIEACRRLLAVIESLASGA